MSINLFQHEINDGLSDRLMSENSVAFECEILGSECLVPVEQSEVTQALAFLDVDRGAELYHLNSVLVSAGWNKNDDVFSVSDLWKARATPVHKPFNYMHNDSDIIGHIVASMAVDGSGARISEDTSEEDLPDHIDILTSAVIYKTRASADQRERIAELIKEIDEGKWSVSMECFFNHFDYAITGPDKEQRVLVRSEESAFLTKHLRVYGGTGQYQGYKIGRILRGFAFSGKGLVSKPANPRSIIFNRKTNPFNTKAELEINTFLSAMEVDMADPKEQTEELVGLRSEIKTLNDSIQAAADAHSSEVASLKQKISDLEETMAAMEDEKKKISKKQGETEEENNSLKKKMRGMQRKAKLEKAGASTEDLESTLAHFEDSSDQQFDAVVALIQKNSKSLEVVAAETEERNSGDSTIASETENHEEEDEEAVVASDLDDAEVVTSPSLANPSDENQEELSIAAAADWFSSKILRTTQTK